MCYTKEEQAILEVCPVAQAASAVYTGTSYMCVCASPRPSFVRSHEKLGIAICFGCPYPVRRYTYVWMGMRALLLCRGRAAVFRGG